MSMPIEMPGHWETLDGAQLADEYGAKARSDLCMGDVSDFVLANRQYLASRTDLDLIVLQTAAKERIRWLSAQLVIAERRGEDQRDLQRLFDLQRAADMRAVARWQAGDELPHCGSLRPLLKEVLKALDDDTGRADLADRLRAELAESAPGGRPLTHPDRADLVVWLIGQIEAGGFIVANGAGDRWRAWDQGMPVWVDDRSKAIRYHRREDADAAHAEDEDAWRIEPYAEKIDA